MIDIGDAVLSVVVQTAEANAQLASFGASVSGQMAPAAAGVTKTSDAVVDLGRKFATGSQGAKELGDVMELSGEKGRFSMYEARGELGLIGEMFGIHLPRHVRSFIAELPGVGAAMSAAFSATAILFIVEALAKGVEKIIEFAHAQDRIDEAWKKVQDSEDKAMAHAEDDILRVMIKVDELTGHNLEALRLKLELIDRTTLEKLRAEFQKLEKEADDAFKVMDRNFLTKLAGFEGSEDAKKKFDEMGKAVDEAFKTRSPEAFDKALKEIEKGVGEAEQKLTEFNQKQKAFEARGPFERSGGNAVDPRAIESWNELIQRAKTWTDLIKDEQVADHLTKVETAIDSLKQKQKELESQAKQTRDAELNQIESTKLQQEIAFNAGKISAKQWADAQIKATDEAALANDKYSATIVGITRRTEDTAERLRQGSIDVQKWADAQKETAAASKTAAAAQTAHNESVKRWLDIQQKAQDALVKTREETKKLEAEIAKIAFPEEKTKDQTQAFKELEAAEKRLGDAQIALAKLDPAQSFEKQKDAIRLLANFHIISKEQEAATIARIQQQEDSAQTFSFRAQEAAIKDLANAKIISKQRESVLLSQLDERERQSSLKILRAQLAEEAQAMAQASKKFADASKDAFFPPTQLALLKAKLDDAKTAWTKTQTDILKVEQTADVRMLANKRSFYAQSFALAVAAGNKELAEKLKTNHAALLAAQAELTEARARGQNVKAIEQEIKELKKIEAELDKEARSAQNLGQVMQQMQQTGTTAMQGMAESFGTAMEAMVSHQQSFGAAMEAATFRLIGQLAQKWGTYFAAKAIADIWWNPGLGAAEFAAAAALFAVGGAMSGLASNIGSKGNSAGASAGGGTAGPAKGSPALSAGSAPAQTINVTHLAAGGLVERPTFAVVGEAGPEAVIPLRDRATLQALAGAIGAQMRAAGGGGGTITIHLKTDTHQFVKELNHNVKTGRVRLEASNTRKITRQS